jgi:HTH-type transcriptional regulator, sugar sensing transcriptional regulator
MTAQDATAELLGELGFSQYEARAYMGLLGQGPLTGYALSVRTQIPQPKVYETLRRLEVKGAVACVSVNPAKYVSVAAERLVAVLRDQYDRRIDEVRIGLEELQGPSSMPEWRVLESLRSWPAIAERARSMISRARRHVYISLHSDQLDDLARELRAADAAGVRCDVVCFGHAALELKNGRFLQHSSTHGVVYRHHQARHLALVADSESAAWALAEDGEQWDSQVGPDPLLVAVVKGYIRHDIYVQQIFADFGDELVRRYGESLEQLILPAEAPAEEASRPAGGKATTAGKAAAAAKPAAAGKAAGKAKPASAGPDGRTGQERGSSRRGSARQSA